MVIVLLTLAAYQFSEMMMAEYRAADSFARSAQARAFAESGVNYVAAALSNPETFTNVLGGNALDNTEAFLNVPVGPADARRPGRFTVVAPPETVSSFGTPTPRYGVVDEAGKINLNALLKIDSSGGVARTMLLLLPQLAEQEDVVDAILDWIDADDEPRTNGAENDSYLAQNPSYRCKNGPLDTLEELLLVRGVTPELLFGNDRNRNGVLDPDEDDGSGAFDRGLSEYLTVYSREQNTDTAGSPRIYINDADLEGLLTKLTTALGEELAIYIIAYRLYGTTSSGSSTPTSPTPPASGGSAPAGGGSTGGSAPSSGSGGGSSSSQSGGSGRLSRNQLNLQSGRPQRIASLFDLVNSTVTITTTEGNRQIQVVYASPLTDAGTLRQLLPLLLDKVTTTQDAELPGRINVNTAPEAVLRTLPGVQEQETDIQNVLTFRPDPATGQQTDPIYQTPAWLITEAGLSPQTLRTLERYITARSQVYRAHVVGYFEGGGPTARVEAVIDTNNGRPRLVYWRDLTELGKGMDLQNLTESGTGR